MPDEKIYTEALESFQSRFHMERYDLRKSALRQSQFGYINSTYNSTTPRKYLRWLASAAYACFENTTELKDQGTPSLETFSAEEFADAFEALVDADFRSKLENGDDRTRPAFEGLKRKRAIAVVNASMRSFNRTLPDMWGERLKLGVMKVDKMEAITDQLYQRMTNGVVDRSTMKNELTKVVAAHEAMQKLRATRGGFWGFFWRLIYKDQNRLEENYLAKLNTQINTLRDMKYKVDDTERDLKDWNIFGRSITGSNFRKEVQPTVAASPTSSSTETAQKSNKIEAVTRRINELIEDGDVQEDIVNDWKEKLPGDEKTSFMRATLYTNLLSGIVDHMKAVNERFDEGIASNGDPKKEMSRVVRTVFKKAEATARVLLGGEDVETKAQAMSLMTQTIVSRLTAAAFYPDQLNEVVKDYIEKNVAQYKEIVEAGKEYAKEIETYETQLEKGLISEYEPRQHVFDGGDKVFEDNNAKKSEQITQSNQKEVPTITHSNL